MDKALIKLFDLAAITTSPLPFIIQETSLVRASKTTVDVFSTPVVEASTQTSNKPSGISALEKLKAKRVK